MMIFGKLSAKLKSQLNLNGISKKIFNEFAVKRYIITLIQDRLYETGKDSDEKQLKTDSNRKLLSDFYSDSTILIKSGKRDKPGGGSRGDSRISNVTLKDSGSFYNSMNVIAEQTFYNLKADFEKEDGKSIGDNFEKSYSNNSDFEKHIMALSDNDLSEFIEKVYKSKFINLYKETIQKSVQLCKE